MGAGKQPLPPPDLVASALAASLGPQAHSPSPSENGLQMHLPPSPPKWSQMVPETSQNGGQKSSNRPFFMKLCTLILAAIYYTLATFGDLQLDPNTSKKDFHNAFGIAEPQYQKNMLN